MPVSYLSKKLSPYVRVAAIIVVAALMVFAGLRFYSWRSYGSRTRLITLVNPWNPVSETGYSARLVEVENGMRVDRSCAEPLQRMLADCRAAGRNPVLAGAYRSVDEQLVLHDERFQQLVDEGRSPEEAEAENADSAVAGGECLEVRLYPALSARYRGNHRLQLALLALPLRRGGDRRKHPFSGNYPGGVPLTFLQ